MKDITGKSQQEMLEDSLETRWSGGTMSCPRGSRVGIERNVQLRDVLEKETIGLAENKTCWEGMTEEKNEVMIHSKFSS